MAIEWWVVLATLAGPVIAVQTQKWIERATERRRGQMQVFYWLMATRATRLAAEHVQALNRIELEFRRKSAKEKAVRDAWHFYADKLNDDFPTNEAAQVALATDRDNRFIELLFVMSGYLGFDFDRVQIRRGIYYPRGHGELEERQRKILLGLEHVLDGKLAIPMRVTDFPVSEEAVAAQKLVAEKLAGAYDKDGAVRVRMVKE